jgi:SAM-dependent methyltransferase
VIIGHKFAWGHLPKTGGDATLAFFDLFPELILHADEANTNVKHDLFPDREREIAGKILALNIRRLPAWTLSYEHHKSRSGVYPEYKPLPMASTAEMAESNLPDKMIEWFTNGGEFRIERWLRTEYLYHDLLDFVSTFTQVSEHQLQAVLRLQKVNAMKYSHDISEWFTRDQIHNMYASNPNWSFIEQELYGSRVDLEVQRNRVSFMIESVPLHDRLPHIVRSQSDKARPSYAGAINELERDEAMLRLLDRQEHFENVAIARGVIERAACIDSELVVSGWILLPQTAFDSVRVFLDGGFVGAAINQVREDIANAFPWNPAAGRSGFSLNKKLPQAQKSGMIDVLAYKDGRPVGRISTLFRNDLDTVSPTPPSDLMAKSAFTTDPHLFKMGGLKSYFDLRDAGRLHGAFDSTGRVLDLGCGCARVTVHLLLHGGLEVFGCDIDPTAIEWCDEHLPSGRFSRNDPWPPTPYEDGAFDMVICHSVFTHFARNVQRTWIPEIRRILAPDGLLMLSVYGATLAEFEHHEIFPVKPQPGAFFGLFATGPSSTLGGILPQGYHYQHVVQSQEFTIEEWSRDFEVLDYIERGIEDSQDLLVMRPLR